MLTLSKVFTQASASPCTTTTQQETTTATDFVETAIADNKVVIFSKSYCPYCKMTKKLFHSLNADATVYELDQMGDDGVAIQAALVALSGQRTVPNVFIGGEHVGGNDDVHAAQRSGSLQAKLQVAGDSL